VMQGVHLSQGGVLAGASPPVTIMAQTKP
jgi:hypothetical protein